jgi:hypothetical protein
MAGARSTPKVGFLAAMSYIHLLLLFGALVFPRVTNLDLVPGRLGHLDLVPLRLQHYFRPHDRLPASTGRCASI